MDEEIKTVAKEGVEEPSKEKKFSFFAMESVDLNKQMDVGPDEQTIWSVDTENRESNSWTDPLGTITQ